VSFQLVSDFQMTGDQPQAVSKLVDGLAQGYKKQTLLGVTGSGKTFTMANVIAKVQRPTLVICHNKTLAAQLYAEFKEFFPQNAVEYFVSYYDYYQPEAYVPQQDLYIEKDADINEEIDKLRHAATQALFSRRDTLIVASVSCIYGLGDPEEYKSFVLNLEKGRAQNRQQVLHQLVDMQYERNDIDFSRGKFRIRGDTLEIQPAYEELALRIEFFGDEVERIVKLDPLTGEVLTELKSVDIYPAKHFVTSQEKLLKAIASIEQELKEQVAKLNGEGKILEAARLEQRTNYDLEMLRQAGYCNGVENYSRHLAGRPAGSSPFTLLDYFPKDYLLFIDESHMTLPQIRGMFNGDRSRKQTLVDFGFRLPSALDNRPLNYDEFDARVNQVVYVSATPSEYEYSHSRQVAEQLVRPTGLLEPTIEIKITKGQIDDLLDEIKQRKARGERVLVTTLTKKMAEDLSHYIHEENIPCHYLHSEIDTLERVEVLKDLRLGRYDVVVGVNLLREGLDLPEVSLVAILDADKEGFLRSTTSLVQTIGRAARHINGEAVLYADQMTQSLQRAVSETNRRRELQVAYNDEHHITPESIRKNLRNILASVYEMDYFTIPAVTEGQEEYLTPEQVPRRILALEAEMKKAAAAMDFERAAELRDLISTLRHIHPGRAVLRIDLANPAPGRTRRPPRRVPRRVEKRVARRMGLG